MGAFQSWPAPQSKDFGVVGMGKVKAGQCAADHPQTRQA